MGHYQKTKWQLGDRFFIYENGKMIWGIIENVNDHDCNILWDDGDQTVEYPSPHGMFWNSLDGKKIKERNET